MAQRVVLVGQTVLDSSGYGSATISPSGSDVNVTLTSVSTDTAVKEPVAKTYLNVVGSSGFLEGTYSGSSDSSDTAFTIGQGESLTCVWTGGDAGANATIRITGTLG